MSRLPDSTPAAAVHTAPQVATRTRGWVRLLSILALLLVVAPPAKSDLSRIGGIIILPCATHAASWGKDIRAVHGIRAGEDMAFQLDASLGAMVVVADNGTGAVPLGTLLGHVLVVRSADVRTLKSEGTGELHLCVMDERTMGYKLGFDVAESGDIRVVVH